MAAISARVINGKYMPKFDFKRKTSNNTSMTSIKRTSCVNSDSGKDSPLIPRKKISQQSSMLEQLTKEYSEAKKAPKTYRQQF